MAISEYNKKNIISLLKNVFIGLIILAVVISIIGSLADSSESNERKELNNNDTINEQSVGFSRSTAETSANIGVTEDIDNIETTEDFSNVEIIDVDYVDMWENYSDDEYKDKWVKIIGKIEKMQYMKNVYFKENIPEGLTNSLSITASDENEYESFSDGDYVVVVGKVKYKTFGTLSIESATIEKANDEDLNVRENYEAVRSAKKTQEINDYKNSAQTVSYESLIREPDKYKGEILKVTVKISQLMAGGILTEAGYRGYTNNDEWYIHYEIPSNVPRIIEKDTVTFYGEFAGLKTMTRALTGVSEYVPKLDAKYHVIN